MKTKKATTKKSANRKPASRKNPGQSAVKSLVRDSVRLFAQPGADLTEKDLEPIVGTLAQIGDSAINQFTEQLAEKIADKVADRMEQLLAGTVAEIRFPQS